MLFRRALFVILSCVFCSTVFADPECPIGYSQQPGYVKLESIYMPAGAYIDTGIVQHSAPEIEAFFKAETTGDIAWFGNRNAAGGCVSFNIAFGGTWYVRYGYSSTNAYSKDDLDATEIISQIYSRSDFHTVKLTSDYKIYFDEVPAGHFATQSDYWTSNNQSILIGKGHYSSGVSRWKSFKISENGVLEWNGIPVRRNRDYAVGMYDTVSGQFFTNAGTGDFIAGPVDPTEFMNFNICSPCPPNTYKDFVGNADCTPCPDGLVSPSGSTSSSECGRVLHLGDKVFHLNSVKKTSPALHIRDENGHVWYGNLYSQDQAND